MDQTAPRVSIPDELFELCCRAIAEHADRDLVGALDVIAKGVDLSGFPDIGACSTESYTRIELLRTLGVSLVLIVWRPGQFSPPHDHGGSRCIVRVVRGIATERRYEVDSGGLAHLIDAERFHAGCVTRCNGADVHAIGNDPTRAEPLLTLHLYTPSPEMRTFPERARSAKPDPFLDALRENPHAFLV